jgi:hypothetical protein
MLQRQIDTIVTRKKLTEEESARLDDLKDALARLSGMECGTAKEVDKRLRRVDRIIEGGPLAGSKLASREGGVTAESLYINQKINDLSSKAETEQMDYRRGRPINTFFGNTKFLRLAKGRAAVPGETTLPGETFLAMPATAVDTGVLLTFSLITLGLLHASLHRQLRTRR